MSSEKDNLTKELDSKLEDLFDEDTLDNEDDDLAAEKKADNQNEKTGKEENSEQSKLLEKDEPENGAADNMPSKTLPVGSFPLDNLNAILLSLDWEITDELIESYLMEIRKLKEEYHEEKYCDYFFRILDNLGRYIKKNLGAAHPESVSMMQSIHRSLETIFLNSELNEVQKKKVFYKEYNKYIKFKHKISLKKAGKSSKIAQTGAETEKFAEVFISRISESLRKVVREELEKVKQEIIDSLGNK